jgi:hypothetical protein
VKSDQIANASTSYRGSTTDDLDTSVSNSDAKTATPRNSRELRYPKSPGRPLEKATVCRPLPHQNQPPRSGTNTPHASPDRDAHDL